jgi:hypothetical protein
MGRKEAYNFLKQFVLEQMRVPEWLRYPMNDLRKMTPPPLPPTLVPGGRHLQLRGGPGGEINTSLRLIGGLLRSQMGDVARGGSEAELPVRF